MTKQWTFWEAKRATNKVVVIPTYNKEKTLAKLAEIEPKDGLIIVGEELMRHCLHYKITELNGSQIAI